MVFKVAVGAGHGGFGVTPGKRTPDGEYEWDFNNKVVKAFILEMKKYKNVEVRRFDDPTGKTDIPLGTRTSSANAWGADVYLSFHHNANTGKWGNWTGTEVHVYKTKPSSSVKLAKKIAPIIADSYGLKDRGIKYANLHITRETKMTAILVEGGFMDSKIDIKKMRNNSILSKAGKETAKGVADLYNLNKKSTSSSGSSSKVSSNGTYKVKSGDALYSIAKDNNLTVKELKELNGLKSNTIYTGQVLNLSKSSTYTVKKGDTLWGISRDHDVKVKDIKDKNNLKSDTIHVGQKLVIEGSTSKPSNKKEPKKQSKSFPLPTVTLRYGDKGSNVEKLQKALNEANFKVGKVDGIFGSKTLDALERFQSIYTPYDIDGIFGPKTRKALNKKVN